MKRGQAEIFGLIIVMVLLILALLFFIKIRQDDSSNINLRSSFRANNLLNAIVSLNYEDEGTEVNMKEMLKNCVDSNNCADTDGNLTEIFSKTLLPSERYEFEANQHVLGSCVEGITASPVRLPRNYKFTLKLCS